MQNLWTFFRRMHNLSDTPGVGNLPASPEPEMEGGPLPQNVEFKTVAMLRRTVCVRIILLMEASGTFCLKPSPPLAEAPVNLEFRHAVKGRLFFG